MTPQNHWDDLASQLGAEPAPEPAPEESSPEPTPPVARRVASAPPRPPRANTNWSSLANDLGLEAVEEPADEAPGGPASNVPGAAAGAPSVAGTSSDAGKMPSHRASESAWPGVSSSATDVASSEAPPEPLPPYRPSFMQPAYRPDARPRQAAQQRSDEHGAVEPKRRDERRPRDADEGRHAQRGSHRGDASSRSDAGAADEPRPESDELGHEHGVEAMLDEILDIEILEHSKGVAGFDEPATEGESEPGRPGRRRRRRGRRNRRGRRPEGREGESRDERSGAERGAEPRGEAEESDEDWSDDARAPLAEGADDEDSGIGYVRPDADEPQSADWDGGETAAADGPDAPFDSLSDDDAGYEAESTDSWDERPKRPSGEGERDRDRGRRRRRRRPRPADERSAARPSSDEDSAEPPSSPSDDVAADLYGEEDVDGAHEDDGDDDAGIGKISHKAIPTWEETINVLIDANMEARARSPRGGGNPRGRGRGRSGGNRGNRGGGGGSRPSGSQNSGS